MDWTIVSFGLAAAFSAVLLVLLLPLLRAQNASKADNTGELLVSSSHRGESSDKNSQATTTSLTNLAVQLAVIDRAQNDMTSLAGQMTSLRDVLINNQSRGAFGEWRMESIVREHPPRGLRLSGNREQQDAARLLHPHA